MTAVLKQELSTEEKAKSYAHYYYRKPALPSEEQLAPMAHCMDTAKALVIEDRNDLMNPGYLAGESGWCILPNGSGFVANHLKMPGVTVDMVNWWFAWHSLDDLRYKIWFPEGHFGISVSEEDRAKVLDPNRMITEKFQGLTHHVVEDVGIGPENIYISFMTPENFGFDMTRFKAPNVGTLIAANGISIAVSAPKGTPKAPAVMCHFIREIPGGVEFRSRFWIGYHIVNKKAEFLLPPGVRIPEAFPKSLALHNVYEYTNLASFLPELYAEQKGAVGSE